jgi:hypothetical protein
VAMVFVALLGAELRPSAQFDAIDRENAEAIGCGRPLGRLQYRLHGLMDHVYRGSSVGKAVQHAWWLSHVQLQDFDNEFQPAFPLSAGCKGRKTHKRA